VDPRSTPSGALGHHLEDKLAQFFADLVPSPANPTAREPGPVQAKAGAVPGNHGFWRDRNKGLLPSRPKSTSGDPEELVEQI